jgi:hypothetical protein
MNAGMRRTETAAVGRMGFPIQSPTVHTDSEALLSHLDELDAGAD